MIKDIVTLYAEKTCDSCKHHHTWNDLKKCQVSEDGFGFKCLNCNEMMITNLIVLLGSRQNLPVKTYITENQSFLTVTGLREYVNELYTDRLENPDVEKFDLMLFRDINKQIFWNTIFHMIDYNLPYDFCLPYEGIGLIQNYKYVNRHCLVHAVDQNEGFNLPVRSRRHKSEVPTY